MSTVRLHADGPDVEFEHLSAGQHTIRWREPVRMLVGGVTTTLGVGQANLYAYPKVISSKPGAAPGGEPAAGAQLAVLEALITAIATSPACAACFETADASGATPILGLLVANTKEAIRLCLALYRLRPALLAQAHGPGPFVGENAFHVAAVNRRERALCAMIQLAHDGLEAPALAAALTAQAAGPFFAALPTAHYGGTPLGYACSFCLRRAVSLLLSLSARSRKLAGAVSLNEPRTVRAGAHHTH